MPEYREEIRQIFEMVYMWGRVGLVVDDSAHAYQDDMKKLIEKVRNETHRIKIKSN